MEKRKSIFDDFTRKYSLSKTLRFELKPVGSTLVNMRNHLGYDEDLQTFLSDQKIEDAYQTLKPVLDSLHEKFITESLELVTAQKSDFSDYLQKYRIRKELTDKDFEVLEKPLRAIFSKSFDGTAKLWKENAGKNEKGKDIFNESGYKILTEKGVLDYIKRNIDSFSSIRSAEEINKALESFKGFFTYFGGFNQNRENYYETSKEAATAVATRVVHENLPKFSDNILFFEERSEEYKNAYDVLKKLGRSLTTKTGEALLPIIGDSFKINHFGQCLSQKQIETYNEQVGNANSLINLYNQSKSDVIGFRKLSLLKILYKQIGCGKRQSLFFALTHDTKKEAEKFRIEKKKEAFSVEEVLELAQKAGEKYFQGKSDDGIVNTVPEFLDYMKNRESYIGVYWSKAAINSISNKYFANWHSVKDRLKKARVFLKASKGSEDDIKIPEAVELEGLFSVLNETKDWKESGVLFRTNLPEERSKIVLHSRTPSQALLGLIFADIADQTKSFLAEARKVKEINKYNEEKNKETIKSWIDHALTISQILKYFLVKESKIRGTALDATISQSLEAILRSDDADWYKWYDALRNYLTRKPQDSAKENKLKLNFETGSLLGGWSNGQEKVKAAVLLKKESSYYLGILKKKNLFDTEKEENPMYLNADEKSGRLILANLKFQTLAGRGFLGEFKKSYGDMGKDDPLRAIKCLQKIIHDRYQKYPLLQRIAKASYNDKKIFDKDIQKTLQECYVCEFAPINWKKVEEHTTLGDIYLFNIHDKGLTEKNLGRKNLQSLYWDEVFEEGSPFQLSGGGEIFYRKQVIKESDIKLKKGYEHKKFIFDIKRFTVEKFIFHCPIKLNYKAKSYSNPKYAFPEINKAINEKLSGNKEVCFLGIDRGEKHLAYYSLIDKGGNIIEQNTLNIPFLDKDGKPRAIKADKKIIKDGMERKETIECWDYNDLLDARAGDRDYARKNWQTIGTIKELKDGYISQVVRKIVDLAVQHGAFIVLEYLNIGFKRGRQKIEKSVYQKLELALAKKLNFLVNKTAKKGEIGSVTNALQLTPPVINFGDIENRKQVGIMLYTKADYTSQTDPITGWRKSIYLKKGSEEDVKKQIVDAFSDIGFDGKDYYFVYKDESTSKEWRLYSGKNGKNLDRFRGERGRDKNEWVSTLQDIVKILDGVFANFDLNRSIHSQIVDDGVELVKIDEHTAWESLRFSIDMIQQIRNNGTDEKDGDFILSPVRNEKSEHFDSRKATKAQPTSGDANGAFNIARKGIIMNEHIRRNYNLYVSDAEWDAWLAGQEKWEKWIKENQKILVRKMAK